MRTYLPGLLAATAGLTLASTTLGDDASSRVSGNIGAEVSTHFVSYGTDVHGQGGKWSRPSVFAWSEVSIDFDHFDVTTGVWFDLRRDHEGPMSRGPLGGPIHEVDWYVGVGTDVQRVRMDVIYQAWMYDNQTEDILDVVVAFDDSDLIIEGFALNPSVVAHTRLSGGTGTGGTVFVLGVEPGYDFDLGDYEISLSVPASIAFGVDDFYMEDGYGYASVGLAAAMPMTFIPAEYGEWELTASTIYYFTDSDAIGNPRDNFITGAVGVAMSF